MANRWKREEVAELLLDEIVTSWGGEFAQGEPGEVLHNLSWVTGFSYSQVRIAVLDLEKKGLVYVYRNTHRESLQHNFIISVRALPKRPMTNKEESK